MRLYQGALLEDVAFNAILRAGLTNQRLAQDEHVPNTTKYPDQLAEPGLVRVEKSGRDGYFRVPYIWLWAMMDTSIQNPLIPVWRFDDYDDLLAKENRTLPTGCSWENFEKLNMKIRSMKSLALKEGQPTTISALHFGARLKGDISFISHHPNPVSAMKQTDTRTLEGNYDKWIIESNDGRVNLREHRHIVLNAKSASAGDTFLSLDAQPTANEVHQYKFHTSDSIIDQEKYEKERKKAASTVDFFILFTTQKAPNIMLPVNSGIVDRENWDSYF
ncbi:hypothetical protein BGX26_012269 [Mortierella sp. AD094]|nr:hypothetical protein BGX26_012269 [Mortierella sp. AD094]